MNNRTPLTLLRHATTHPFSLETRVVRGESMTHRHFQEFDIASIASWLAGMKQANANSVIFALLPESEKDRVADLQLAFNQHGWPLLGAIFPALITETGFATSGLTCLCFPAATQHFLVEGIGSNAEDAARRIADALTGEPGNPPTAESQQLFLVFDSMLPNTGTILSKLFDRLRHQFRYSGVCAGSESFHPMPCLFDNHRLVSDAAIGFLFDAETDIAVQHAYPVSKPLMRATSTAGNRIDKIDGEPAMAVYQRVIASEFGIGLTPDNFYQYAVHYPFGLISSLDVLVRIPVAFNDDGSLYCVGEIPPNSMLRLLKAPSLAQSTCVSRLVALLGSKKSKPLLTFYCAGRRQHFGSDSTAELRDLLEASGSPTIYGALSLGEISGDIELGFPEFHNAALVCVR